MTTLAAARPDLENPMAVGEYYEDVPDDYILRNMYPEDAADYVWAHDLEQDAICYWLGESISLRAARDIWENLKDDMIERISEKYIRAKAAPAFAEWVRRFRYD